MRLFVQPRLGYAGPALLISFLGAVAISITVLMTSSGLSLHLAVIWPLMVAFAAGITMWFNVRMSRRAIAAEDLPRLTLIKACCNGLQGLMWGCGVALLNVPGEAVTVVAPAWAMVTGVGIIVLSTAPWPASSYTFVAALFAPALAFLLTHAGSLEFTIGIAMLVCFPFILLIGRLGAQYVGDLVHARLAVNALLERESQLSARLRQLNLERTRFFSSASHDLRQPLQALNLYTSLIGRAPHGIERSDLLKRLTECADMLDRQFNAILGVAGTDAMIEQAEPRPIALQPIIERAMAGHVADAQAKGLRLRCVPTRAVALAAPEVIERIVSNLIGNAVRYTPVGGVSIGVRRRGDRILLIVADTGIGISPQDQERIFDDFVQVGNPERNSAKGLGLGLAIVKRLADGLGWSIRLASRPGSGSLFSLELPRAEVESPPQLSGDAVPEIDPPFRVPVLVLDDDLLVRDAISRLLASWGAEHQACARAEELYVTLDSMPKRDWIIMLDYRLEGGMTGIEVLDEVRRRYGDRHRFLIVSGEMDPEVETLSRDRNAILLRKPLKPIRLRAALSGLAP